MRAREDNEQMGSIWRATLRLHLHGRAALDRHGASDDAQMQGGLALFP